MRVSNQRANPGAENVLTIVSFATMKVTAYRQQRAPSDTSSPASRRTGDEAVDELVDRALKRRLGPDALLERLEGVERRLRVERLVLVWSKDLGKEVGQDAAEHEIGVG